MAGGVVEGVVVPLVTPYKGSPERVDYEAVEWLVQRLAEAGVTGVFLGGTTGEKNLLTPGEVKGLVEAARRAVGPRLVVLAGTPTGRVSESLEAARLAGEAGADYVMTTPPLYYRPSEAGLLDYYRKLALASGDAGVFIYTIPSHVGYNVPVSVVERLAGEGAVDGIKATVSDLLYIEELALRVKAGNERFSLLVGAADLLPASLPLGADGTVDSLSNVAPGIALSIMEAWRGGDGERLSRLTLTAARLISMLRRHGPQGLLKAALARLGAPVEVHVRPPLEPPPREAVESFTRLLCRDAGGLILPGLKCR